MMDTLNKEEWSHDSRIISNHHWIESSIQNRSNSEHFFNWSYRNHAQQQGNNGIEIRRSSKKEWIRKRQRRTVTITN